MSDLRFPIGKFEAKSGLAEAQIRELIESLSQAPLGLRAAAGGLTPSQLDTPYRPDGWTARQVVNHVADSHLNGYVWHGRHHTAHIMALRQRNGW